MCHFTFSLLDLSFKYAEAYTDMFCCVEAHTALCIHVSLGMHIFYFVSADVVQL